MPLGGSLVLVRMLPIPIDFSFCERDRVAQV